MLRTACIELELPYFPLVSVNRAYNRNNPRQGTKEEVDDWLVVLRTELNKEIKHSRMLNIQGPICMDITLHLPARPLRKGRDPDTSNFRKIPQDCIAAVLGVDDSIFYGTDHPIAVGDNLMVIDLSWDYLVNQPDAPIQNTSVLPMGPLLQSTVPCELCEIANCPCKKADGHYEEREKRILLWWRTKTK